MRLISTMVNESKFYERIEEIKNCIVSKFLVSKDLINACHVDCFDKSHSITTWVEEIEGDAEGWNFILPNIMSDGENGTVIPLTHGKTISWDGTKKFHCSDLTNFFLSSKFFFFCVFILINDMGCYNIRNSYRCSMLKMRSNPAIANIISYFHSSHD